MKRILSPKLLFFYDTIVDTEILIKIFNDLGYETYSCSSFDGFKKFIDENPPDLIFLDLDKDEKEIVDTIYNLREMTKDKNIPILLTKNQRDSDVLEYIFGWVNLDYIGKPYHMGEIMSRVNSHLALRNLENKVKEYENDASLLIKEQTETLIYRQINFFNEVLSEIENTDPLNTNTSDHLITLVKRLSEVVTSSGVFDNLPDDFSSKMEKASLIHDIGKLLIPRDYLSRLDRLNNDEYDLYKSHTIKGEKIINSMISNFGSHPVLELAREIALYHHENWDGSGYPRALKAEEIPFSSRLFAICDIYDTLRSTPIPHEEAISFMDSSKEKYFDPRLYILFKELVPSIKNLYE